MILYKSIDLRLEIIVGVSAQIVHMAIVVDYQPNKLVAAYTDIWTVASYTNSTVCPLREESNMFRFQVVFEKLKNCMDNFTGQHKQYVIFKHVPAEVWLTYTGPSGASTERTQCNILFFANTNSTTGGACAIKGNVREHFYTEDYMY